MYNLLISARGWTGSVDRLDSIRILEHTPDHLRTAFDPLTASSFDHVRALPTLFAPERGMGGEVARVGTILSLRAVGRETEITYVFAPDVDPIPYAVLEDMQRELHIDD